MNYNQKILERALREEINKANITYNKYREILDVCLAALEEPAQASESKQVDLKELHFLFVDTYSEEIKKFSEDLSRLIRSGQLIAFKKDNELKGLKPTTSMFDEMHEYPCGPLVKLEFKDDNKKSFIDKMFKVWNKEKSNLVYEPVLPIGATIKPEPMEVEYVGDEWLFEKANEFKENVLGMIRKDYENNKITFEDYADKVAKLNIWRMAMNSKKKKPKEQLDEMHKHKTNLFIREEKDDHAERLNEIADKVNKIYAVLNERVHPLVKRIDNDVHQVKKQTEASKLNTTNTTVHYTGGQLTEEQANEFLSKIKNDLAKSIREDRLKGGKY